MCQMAVSAVCPLAIRKFGFPALPIELVFVAEQNHLARVRFSDLALH